jgi:[acyl-carrier-protein] S-malonyltransferase
VIFMRYALVFPGQGAQEVGMGKSLHDQFPSARAVFGEADDALGFSLSRVIFEGPAENLRRTVHAQPAILTVSIAALRVLEGEMGYSLAPSLSAGHSLGEYTALVAAGALSLADGVRLVQMRGKWMQEAVPEGEGTMAAVMGLEPEELKRICASVAPNAECQVANFNAPGQYVVSGKTEFVNKAVEAAKAGGAKRAVPLNVSAPFHSALMRPVADLLGERFAQCEWNAPKWPVVCNVWARALSDPGEIRRALYEQTYSPVRWIDSVNFMADAGVERFYELGPGNVLAGLIKRCRKGLQAFSAVKPKDLSAIGAGLADPE